LTKKGFEISEPGNVGPHLCKKKKKTEVQNGLVSGAQKTGPNGLVSGAQKTGPNGLVYGAQKNRSKWSLKQFNVDGQPQFFFWKKVQKMGCLVGSTSYNRVPNGVCVQMMGRFISLVLFI
jgi:hypothetical protein